LIEWRLSMGPRAKARFSVEDVEDGAVYDATGPKKDPWKGFGGGLNDANGFVVTCSRIRQKKDYAESWLCRVDIRVERHEGGGAFQAKFLMHPTFDESELLLTADSVDGVASEYFWAIGPFVVGIVIMENGVEIARLELDIEKLGTEVDLAPPGWWRR
jgi:hypothetical protein